MKGIVIIIQRSCIFVFTLLLCILVFLSIQVLYRVLMWEKHQGIVVRSCVSSRVNSRGAKLYSAAIQTKDLCCKGDAERVSVLPFGNCWMSHRWYSELLCNEYSPGRLVWLYVDGNTHAGAFIVEFGFGECMFLLFPLCLLLIILGITRVGNSAHRDRATDGHEA